MPAPSSSLTDPVIGHLAGLAGDAADDAAGLLAVLAKVADPRHRRGVRHRLVVILGLAVCAVLAGARSFTAIAEWAADADEQTLGRLGVTGCVPSESTFRRALQRLDAGAFDDLAGAWAAQRTAPGPGGRRVIAVDGKTLRGSGHGSEGSRHLLAALDHAHGAVLGEVEVGAKTNEIPLFSTLLDCLEITGAVITADALHAQREHATYLAGRGAHYLLIVKRNQPGLHAQLAALPWRDVPVAHDKRERGHGRTERRTLKVTAVAAGLAFPHAAQAIQITRRRKVKAQWSRETCYAVTSLTITQASHAQLADIIRGHWGIEDRLHWVRDMDFDEDRSQIRTAAGPHIMASLRNLVITILRLAGAPSIAAALRYHARRPSRPREQQTTNTSSLIADLTSALASDPTNALLCLRLASAYRESGSLPEAVSYATRALETGSAEVAPMAAMFLGIMYGQLKNFTEAEAAYGIAIESRHEVATPRAAGYLAEILRSQGRNAEAASLLNLAIETGDPALSQISSRELGILLEYAERPVEAEAAYQSAISGPDHDVSVTAAHDLALLYEKERCLRQAEQAYIDLIKGEHAGAAQKAALNLSRLLAQQGRCQEAEVLVRRAAEGPDPGTRVLAADAIQALSNLFRSGIGMSPRLTIEVENTHLRVRGSKALSESPVHRCLKEYLDGNFERARDLALSALDAPTSFQQRGESLLDSALYALVGQRAAENLGDNASADLAFAAAETVWLIPTARWLEHYSILAIDSRITFLAQTGRYEECVALATQILIAGMLPTEFASYLVTCLLGRQYVAEYLFQLAIRMVSGEFPALVDSKFEEVDEEVKAAFASSFEVLTRSFDYAVTEASVYKVVASAHHGVPFILWLRSYDLEIAVRPNERGLFTFIQSDNNYEELLLGNIAGPVSVVTPLNPTMPPLPQATIPRLPMSLQNWQHTVQFLTAIADLVVMTIGDPTAGVSEELSVLHRMGLSAKVVVLRMPVTAVESDPVIAAVLGEVDGSSADERQAQAEEFWRGFADAYPGFPSPVRMSGDALVDMGEINTRLSEVLSFLETSASVTRDVRLSRRTE